MRAGRTTTCPTQVVGLGAVQSAGPPRAINRQRPRLSENFNQTHVPSTNSISHAKTNPTGQAPVANIAGPPVVSRMDFIQINCGKRIAAMTLMESNVRGKIALIQEPYTSIWGCALLHKRDYYSSSTPAGSPTTGLAVVSTTGSPSTKCPMDIHKAPGCNIRTGWIRCPTCV
jgi:hypothetical protein